MTEYTDSFEIYNLISGLIVGPSQNSLRTRWNSIGIGNLSMGVKASPSGPLSLYLPFGASISKTFLHQTKYTLGFRLNISSLSGVGGGAGSSLIDFCNCQRTLASLGVNPDGSVILFGNNTGSTVICQNATVNLVTAATDCYVELIVVATDTGTDINVSGQIWIDNVMVASGNVNIGRNKNTLNSQAADFNSIFINSGVSTNGQAYIWDLYLTDGSGTTNTGRLGSSIAPYGITSQPILPNADTSTVQWTPLSGSVHFSEINELPADGDTSYNATNVTGKIDSYDWQPIPTFTGTVKSVQISYSCRSTAEGTMILKQNIGPAGVEQKGNSFGLCSTFNYQNHQAFDLDPATGLAWLQSNFNIKAFGIELT